MNLTKCRRCKADVKVGPHATNKRFCSKDCYDTWWNEQRSRRVTRSEVARQIIGTPDPKFRLTQVQSAWLAGLVDGEGCIGIWRQTLKGNRSGYTYRSAIEIANTNRPILEAIEKIVDGWVCIKDARKNRAHKVLHVLLVRPRAVKRVLEHIAPFLIVKKRQADLVIEFRRLMEAAPMRTEREHEAFAALYAECRALNKRGRPRGG